MKSTFLFLAIFSFSGYTQTITGIDQSLAGTKLSLCTYSEFITNVEKQLAETTVAADGSFTLKGNLSKVQYCFLKAGNNYADFYAEPGKTYKVNWPNFTKGKDEARPYFEKTVKPLVVQGTDTLELNSSIRRFNTFYDTFLEKNASSIIVRSRAGAVVKQLRKVAYTQIGNITDAQFRTYVDYNLAIVEQLASGNKSYIYNGFLKTKPVRPFDLMYMEFFHQFYEKQVDAMVLSNKDIRLLQILNKGYSWVEFDKELAKKPFLENDTLRQMATVKNFRTLYHDKAIKKESVIAMLEIMSRESRLDFIRIAAANMKEQLLFLSPGGVVPKFSLETTDGNTLSSSDLKGRFVYLEITDPACAACLAETKAIAVYKKKYGEKIRFVTIMLNTTKAKATQFKNANKIDWDVLYSPPAGTLADDFGVVSIPQYFILNPDGKFFRSPALKPSQAVEKDFSDIKFKW